MTTAPNSSAVTRASTGRTARRRAPARACMPAIVHELRGARATERGLRGTVRSPLPMSASTAPPIRASRRGAMLPWAVWLVAVLEAAVVALAPLIFPQIGAIVAEEGDVGFVAFLVTIAVIVLVFATSGLLVTRQQRRNLVGGLLLAGG